MLAANAAGQKPERRGVDQSNDSIDGEGFRTIGESAKSEHVAF